MCATRIDEDHHAFSIDSAGNAMNGSLTASPRSPGQSPPSRRRTHALSPNWSSVRKFLPYDCPMKAARVGGSPKHGTWTTSPECAAHCLVRHPFHSACGRIINDRMPLCEDTHTSHYCSQCYESMQPNVDALPCA